MSALMGLACLTEEQMKTSLPQMVCTSLVTGTSRQGKIPIYTHSSRSRSCNVSLQHGCILQGACHSLFDGSKAHMFTKSPVWDLTQMQSFENSAYYVGCQTEIGPHVFPGNYFHKKIERSIWIACIGGQMTLRLKT